MGLCISPKKSQLMPFSRWNKDSSDLNVTVGSDLVRISGYHKYLCIILDRRLNWLPHLKFIAGRAMKKINIIKFK